MARSLSKHEFLAAVQGGFDGARLEWLHTDDACVRDSILVAAQAVQMGLVRVVKGMDGLANQLRITPAGSLLLQDRVDEAAAAIDSGRTIIRFQGAAPFGSVAQRLAPGGHGMALDTMWARTNSPEILRGISTSHLVVEGDYVRAVANPPSAMEAQDLKKVEALVERHARPEGKRTAMWHQVEGRR